jgi:uncharacterized membrane protein
MTQQLTHPNRIAAFDLARGLAVFFMATVHALGIYANPETYDSVFGWVVEFFGSAPAAPVFMFLMGAVIAFSRRAGFVTMLRRGIALLALGYLLNTLRGSLPMWIAIQAGVSLEELGGATPLTELLSVDILQFAGMAYLTLAVVRRITRNPWIWIALAAVVACVSPLIWGFETGVPVLDGVFSLLGGGDGENVSFPLVAWIAYPLVGMAVGTWLATTDDVGKSFRRLALAGTGLLIIGGAITLTNIDFHIGDYWRTGPGGVVLITGFVLLWLSGCQAIASRVLLTGPGKLLAFWSRNVTVFYFIHWVLLGWSVLLVGYESYGVLGTLIGMVVIVLLGTGLTQVWVRLRKLTRRERKP